MRPFPAVPGPRPAPSGGPPADASLRPAPARTPGAAAPGRALAPPPPRGCGSSSRIRSTAQAWLRSPRSKYATSGPVSAIAAPATPQVFEVLRIRRKVGDARIHYAARRRHQIVEALALVLAMARRLQHEPQALLDQVLELAAAQRRLGLGAAKQLLG